MMMTPFEILNILSAGDIHFTLASYREGAVMFIASVPGERWEIEAFADGTVEFEIFKSGGDIYGADELLKRVREAAADDEA